MEPNHTVDEIVDAFKTIRRSLMQAIAESKGTDTGAKVEQGQCPICNGFFDITKVESHVEKCLEKQRIDSSTKPQRQPISKPVFALMKDAQLKKTLTDFSLPTNGDRPVPISIINYNLSVRF